jgi:predicted nucleic acid-binding protein
MRCLMPSLPLLVTDTNIWIDLHHAAVIEVVFRLPYRFLASDFVLGSELRQPPLDLLRRYGLELISLDPSLIGELSLLRPKYGGLSVQDIAAFLVARQYSAVLLTGDRRLADLGIARGLTVHGVLWLLDEIVANNLLTTAEAASGLESMLDGGARLPHEECQKRLRLWVTR